MCLSISKLIIYMNLYWCGYIENKCLLYNKYY